MISVNVINKGTERGLYFYQNVQNKSITFVRELRNDKVRENVFCNTVAILDINKNKNKLYQYILILQTIKKQIDIFG